MNPFTPAHRPLRRVADGRRTLRAPDLRQLPEPRLSGARLGNEIDHDELILHRAYRVYTDPMIDKFTHAKLDEPHVKYFVFEFSQRNPGDDEWYSGVKVVRMLRLTRVPRYLRQGGSGSMNLVFEQQRDVLMALRQEQVLFLNLVARSPDLPLVFAYGVQAVGATFEEAAAKADESYAVLHHQLHGTYQQLMTKPLTIDEGEALARYQSEWGHIAMARGRPMPVGGTLGASSALDGNRTDVESANNQLEAFIRGMSNSSFMLSLVTVPLSPAEMATAWRNISHKLSEVRSDQQGARGVSAGVAMPLTLGASFGYSQGDSRSTGASEGVGDSYGISRSVADSYTYGESVGVSESRSVGESASVTVGESQSVTVGESQSVTVGESQSVSVGESVAVTVGESATISAGENASVSAGENIAVTDSVNVGESRSVSLGETLSQSDQVGRSVSAGQSASVSETVSQGVSATQTVGESASVSEGVSRSTSLGQTIGLSQSSGLSQGTSVSEGQSLGATRTTGANWSSSLSDAFGATQSRADGFSKSFSESMQQAFQVSNQWGDSIQGGSNFGQGHNVSGGLLGFSGGQNQQSGSSFGTGLSNTDGLSLGLTRGGTLTDGLTSTLTNGLSQTVTRGESMGGSVSEALSATNSVSLGRSLTASESLTASQSQSVSETIAASQGLSRGVTASQSVGQSLGQSVGLTQGQSLSESASMGRSVGTSVAATQAAGQSVGAGQSLSSGLSAGTATGVSSGASQGITSAATQSASVGASQSVSASATQGVSTAATQGVSSSETRGVSASASAGTSQSASESVGRSVTDGQSSGIASNQQLSDAYMVAMSRSAQNTGSLGVVPNFGVHVTRQTFDEAKRMLGDILEAQMKRYIEGLETAGFLYQMFLVAPDRETLAGGAGLLVSAFAGSGTDQGRVAQRFHTITEFEDGERDRLLDHFRVFTSYRKREPVVEEISPFLYSSYVTASEMSAFCHPPTSEAAGLLAVHDSAPVLALPADRQEKELFLGYLFNGERAEVTPLRFGIDVGEQTHSLITGVTGSGKTTTLLRLLTELTQVRREVAMPGGPGQMPQPKEVRASILGLDWMRNMRNLASVVEPDRFRFYSIAKPEMGEFRWNLLAIPTAGMAPNEWLNQLADNMVASWNLGEFGRSLIAEFLGDLYAINRLADEDLLPPRTDSDGVILRPGVTLEAVDPDTLPDGAIQYNANGEPYANVYTCPELSRLVSIEHLAVLVMRRVEEMSTTEAARMSGTSMRDRLQSLWRRISYFAPGGQLSDLLGCDPSLDQRATLTVEDLVDPDKGLVTIIETDGLDLANRRLVLGSVLLAVYRHGLAHGEGTFDHGGRGPGTHIVLEEAHELFGEGGEDDDSFSVATRNALYESMFRRARALGIRLACVAQNPGALPIGVTSNTSTVFVHRTYDKNDRQRVFDLLNWNNQVGQQQREWRWLGEMPRGYCIARLDARESFLESAPMQFKAEPAPLEQLTDADMVSRAAAARRAGRA